MNSNSKEITDLHPDLQTKCREFLLKCKLAGLDVKITHTWRSPEYQNELYAQGRTTPGKIVTGLRGSMSKHCFMLNGKPAAKAFDFGVFDKGTYITNGEDKRYLQAGEIGEALGLGWGGRWKVPHDPSHLELKDQPTTKKET